MFGNKVNRCQPGYGASCSLCCGSHNYTMPSERIEELFQKRGQDFSTHELKHPDESCFEKLFHDAMQCSHVGMSSTDPGVICCLIYDAAERGEAVESFFQGTCRNFYCQAWHDLTDRQVLFAARLMGDWYYYSLFINDIEAVQDVCARYTHPEDVPYEELETLKSDLIERLMDEDGK